ARHPRTSPKVLAILAKKGIMAVAWNPNTPVGCYDDLLNGRNRYFLFDIAENPSTPAPLLDRLSWNDDPDVRFVVAENRSSPVEILVRLSDDQNDDVRGEVCENINTPLAIQEKLKWQYSLRETVKCMDPGFEFDLVRCPNQDCGRMVTFCEDYCEECCEHFPREFIRSVYERENKRLKELMDASPEEMKARVLAADPAEITYLVKFMLDDPLKHDLIEVARDK
ncbi:MAG: HEAT repeat domain-containing protein, partial [Promethearchaeota archaeon]